MGKLVRGRMREMVDGTNCHHDIPPALRVERVCVVVVQAVAQVVVKVVRYRSHLGQWAARVKVLESHSHVADEVVKEWFRC